MAKSLKEQIEVMEWFLNGGEVEISSVDSNSKWEVRKEPKWDWTRYNYRIKEQSKTITIEKWLCEYNRCELLEGSKRFFILEKAIPFEFGKGKKIKLLETYKVQL